MQDATSPLRGKEERKKLRKAQREVSDQILANKEQLDKPDSDAFNIHRDRNNELKKQVLHAREFLYDSQNVKALAKSVRNAASHLDDISRRYDFASFAASLTTQYGASSAERGAAGTFSWVSYGKDVSILSRKREQLSTMFGPVGKEVANKTVTQRQRAPRGDSSEKVVAQVLSNTEDDEESEATNLRIKQLHSLIQEESRFDLLDLLVDRLDPVQTVENFFDFAFLIKEKRASQELVRDGPADGLLLSRPLDPAKVAMDKRARQQVLSMSIEDVRTVAELMKDIDELSRHKGVDCGQRDAIPKLRSAEERGILHRNDPLYRAENAIQQADILAQQSKEKIRASAASSSVKRKRTESSGLGRKKKK